MAEEAVARLEIRTAGVNYTTHGSIEICGNEQFSLGRDPESCRYTWPNDLTISRQHLRIHCILYDRHPDSNIAPFVYATNLSVNGTYLKKSNSKCAGSQGNGILMGRGNTFLLEPDDELHISESIHLIFRSDRPFKEAEFTEIQEREKAMFAGDIFITDRLLGQGGYGKVLIGIDQATYRQLACKVIPLDHLYTEPHIPNLRLPTDPHKQKVTVRRKHWPTRVAACFREFVILKNLSHPNIVSIEKVFWSNNTIYIMQELVTGGDLFSFVEYNGGRLDELQAAVIIRQILLGIRYIHARGIVHRDLKLDNILMTSLDDGARIVITDFGSARYLPEVLNRKTHPSSKCQRMFTTAGTLEYIAPEIYGMNPTAPEEGGYTKSVDMWSLGVITATLLTGEILFSDAAYPDHHGDPLWIILGLAARCDLSMLDDEYHPSWSRIGLTPKDFIKHLLVLEEDARMTADDALKHSWFVSEEFDNLYTRSVRNWQPRSPDSQLVQRISRALPNLTAIGLPGQALDQDTVSRFFHPSEQQMTHNVMQSLSDSQHWRASSPLPAISDGGNNAGFQFASPPAIPSCDTDGGLASHREGSVDDSSEQQRCYYDREFTPQFDEYHQNSNSDRVPQQERCLVYMPMGAEYAMMHERSQVNNQESTDSLNNVSDVSYSQYCHRTKVNHVVTKESPEIVLVHATPPTLGGNAESIGEGRRRKTQYTQESGNDSSSAEERASIIVYETPPERQTSQRGSHGDDYTNYRRQCKDIAVNYQLGGWGEDDIENRDPWSMLCRH